MSALINKFNDLEFQEIVMSSNSISEVAQKLGYRSKGGGVVSMIKDRISKLSIDISHFCPYSSGAMKGKKNTNQMTIFLQKTPVILIILL